MGLGSTAKKVQRLSTLAEKLYEQVNEVLERLSAVHDRVETAAEDVESVRHEQREQRAILEALAEEQAVDVEAVVADLDAREPGSDEGTGEPDDGTTEQPGDAEAPADAS